MKRIIAMILVLLCILSLPMAAFAEGTDGVITIRPENADTDIDQQQNSENPPAETPQNDTSAEQETEVKPQEDTKVEVEVKPEEEDSKVEVKYEEDKPADTKPSYAKQARAVIGANLNDEQIAAVYQAFGVKRGEVPELTVNNAEERKYLEGYVPESLIGTRSISCVYVEVLDEGEGMDVTTSNINWVTAEMYISTLATAGITDAKIVVASPLEVSGTAALTGVYKAYEDITGFELNELAKAVSTQELTITSSLADEIGSMDSMAIVNDLKMMLDETRNMSDEEIKEQIVQITGRYNVTLTDKQIDMLISLCRSLEGLDPDALKQRVEEVQETLKKVSGAKTKVVGFVQAVKKVVESVKSFFERIGDIIGLHK